MSLRKARGSVKLLLLCLLLIMSLIQTFSIWMPPVAASGGSSVQQSAVSASSIAGKSCSNCPGGQAMDSQIAVGYYLGNRYVIQAEVIAINIYSGGSNTLYGSFNFGDLVNKPYNWFCGDPSVIFDAQSQKWIAAIINDPSGAQCNLSTGGPFSGTVAVAVSYNSDPTTPFKLLNPIPWQLFQITQTSGSGNSFPDHPEIAISSDKLVITTSSAGNPYVVIKKSDLVNWPTSCCSYSAQQPGLGSNIICDSEITPVRAINPSTPQYLLCLHSNSVQLFSIDGVPGVGSGVNQPNSETPIASVNAPPCISVPLEPGTALDTACPANGNWFFTQNAYWFQDKLWFASPNSCPASTGNTGHSCIHLTKFSTSPLQQVQDFDYGITGLDVYLPSVVFDGLGDLGFVFAYSSHSVYPSLALAGQITDESSAIYTPYVTIATSLSWTSRFMDYFGTSPDPGASNQIWAVGQYWPSTWTIPCGSQPSCAPGWATMISSLSVVGLSLSANPSAFWIDSGWTASTTVSVQARGGFSSAVNGAVSLSASVSPSTAGTGSVSPTSLQISLGGTGGAVASASDASTVLWPGSYTLLVTAQTPDLSLTLPITVLVTSFDFAMSASPSSLSIQPEYCCSTSGTSTLTVTLAVGVVGPTATFSSTGQPSYMQIAYSPSPALVNNPPGTAVTVAFNIPAGGKIYTTQTYSIIITGTADGVSHSVTVSVTVYFDCTRAGCFNTPSP